MTDTPIPAPTAENLLLPPEPRIALPINRCNLPASLIASLIFQLHPQPIELDGIHPHRDDLFARLARCPDHKARRNCFADYMAVHFRLPGYPLSAWPEADEKMLKKIQIFYELVLKTLFLEFHNIYQI